MTRLFLARHAETTWHAENRYAGTSDIDLTPAGRDQARRLAAWAADARLDAVWTSPLRRAQASAAPAAEAAGAPLFTDPELAEVHFGIAEGHRLDELPPAVVEAFRADPVAGAFPGAEDFGRAAARGVAALRRIAHRHEDGRVLVVAHSTLLRLTLCELLGIAVARYRTVFPQLVNCAPSELDLTGEVAGLRSLNLPLPPGP